MAEAILSDLATKITKGLGSLLAQEIGLASGVKKELKKLEETLSKFNAILLDAEKKGAMNHEVKDWLRKLKEVAYDAEDVVDEFATEALRQKVEFPKNMVAKQVRRSFSSSNPLVFRLKMGHRVKKIMERLDRLENDKVYSTFQSTPVPTVDEIVEPIVIASGVLGRENDKENLVNELLFTSSSGSGSGSGSGSCGGVIMVIPIIGLGGLGKTTLAHCVYNDKRVISHFDLRMWVCVSFDFDVVSLAKKILKSMSNEKCDEPDEAKSLVREKLSKKRFLLVLDDVWNEHRGEWENFRNLLIGGEPEPSTGSMIMVTTRSEMVASIMQPIKSLYPLKELDEKDCQSLFNEWAFGGKGNKEEAIKNHGELVEIGKDIVKKCGGVPLAAKALGGLLCRSRDKKYWLNVRDTEIWNLEDEKEILPALWISYNHLPSHLKQCFAYCSLFPQDHEIKVDDLIHQWMAHGFIQGSSSGGSHSMTFEDIGKGYFRELLGRSFFQEAVGEDGTIDRCCKMHDLVHNLARSVGGKEWWEVEYSSSSLGNNKNTPMSDQIPQGVGVKHMGGFPRDVYTFERGIDIAPLVKAQKLRTLHLHCSCFPYHSQISSVGFVSILQRGLRVLKLRNLGMRDVPSSIGDLQQLRYLDLSGNRFEALPNSIFSLYNLQTLGLEECFHFREWPSSGDITKMVSLRHLEFDGKSQVRNMPRGLGQLASLQTLGCFAVGKGNGRSSIKKRKMGGLGDLHGLNKLGGKFAITGLCNVRDARDAKEAKLNEKSELQSLVLDWERDLDSEPHVEEEQVLANLQPHPNLEELAIDNYHGVKMPRWMIRSSSLLPNLVQLTLSSCKDVTCLPLVGEFPCLKFLTLDRLDVLKSICNKVVMRGNKEGEEGKPLVVLFPQLQRLSVSTVYKLERWTVSVVEKDDESVAAASTTAEEALVVQQQQQNHNLHLLSSMFPCLTHLHLSYCLRLTTVPMLSEGGIQHLNSLRKLHLEDLAFVSLPDCPAPATLEELKIKGCSSLVKLPDCFFDNLKLLSSLKISSCAMLTSLPEGFRNLTTLQRLRIRGCPGLTTLPQGLGNLSSLERFDIWDCSNLSTLPEGIQHLTALRRVKIRSCPGLRSLLDGLGNLPLLQEIEISDFPNLLSLPEDILHLTALKVLKITRCGGLRSLPDGLGNLPLLQKIMIDDCPSLLLSLTEGIDQHLVPRCPGLTVLPDGVLLEIVHRSPERASMSSASLSDTAE